MWYEAAGNDTDVVLYSRAAISRNIKGFPFTSKMTSADKESVIEMVRNASSGGNLSFVRVDELDDVAKADIFHQYLAGFNYLEDGDHRALLMSKDQSLSVLVNESEHFVVYSYEAGSNMSEAYAKAETVALGFERQMDIAFSEKMGFLTSDINRVGTGLMLGYVISIPGIEKTAGLLANISKRFNQYDWVLEPIDKTIAGKQQSLYALHSIATLGVTEKEVISNAALVLSDVIKIERSCRQNILKKKYSVVEDQYYRAYALLANSRRMEPAEAFNLLSWLRLGNGYIKDDTTGVDINKINRMTNAIRREYDLRKAGSAKAPQFASNRAERLRSIINGGQS